MSKKVSKKDLSPEARAIINSQVTRRGLIAGTGAVGAAGLLAACGSSGDGGGGGDAGGNAGESGTGIDGKIRSIKSNAVSVADESSSWRAFSSVTTLPAASRS